jgi:hypothetical protein
MTSIYCLVNFFPDLGCHVFVYCITSTQPTNSGMISQRHLFYIYIVYSCGIITFSARFCKPHFCIYTYLFYLSIYSCSHTTQNVGFTYFTAWSAHKTLWACPHIASITTSEWTEIWNTQWTTWNHGPSKLQVMPIHWHIFCSQKENNIVVWICSTFIHNKTYSDWKY